MCGLAGFIDFHNQQPLDRCSSNLSRMGQQLSRRGPDDQKQIKLPPINLVFNRLSIVDVEGGQQPIWNEDRTIFVAINGEIYNHISLRSQLRDSHQFRSNSDAEIVLHLYEERGIKAIESLNGMFAICIWDAGLQQLVLVRDRLGIKPLYYTQVGSQLIFASTLFSLLAHPDAPRTPQFPDMFNLSLTNSYVRGVNRLAGGHYLVWDATTTEIVPKCYWNLADYLSLCSKSSSRKRQDYIAEYRELFVDSVRLRLMSDVPLGISLSGGLDSAIVAAVANQFQPQLHCFSIFADYTLENGDIIEARKVCQDLQLFFHPVYYNPESFLNTLDFSLESLEYFVWMIEFPYIDLEWLFRHELYRYIRTVMPEVKVLLLGQGADEFAGGYTVAEDIAAENWQDAEQQIDKSLWKAKQIKQELKSKKAYLSDQDIPDIPEPADGTSFQKNMLYRVYTLQRFNLWHEDRTSSSQGLEARVPFLDHRLVEFLAAVPPEEHDYLFWNKTIVREMATEWFSKSFTHRAKSFSRPPSISEKFKYQMVQKIFADFQDKYKDVTFVNPHQISQWFNCSNIKNSEGIEATDNLLTAMAMTIFTVLCFSQPNYWPDDYFYGSSSLTEKFDF